MRGLSWMLEVGVPALMNLPRVLMVGVVKAYRLLLKPWLGNACRFEPTCSQYALTALETHGALVGGTLAAGRLLRCHPWCEGGCDEVLPVSGVSMAQPRPGAKSSEPSPLSAQEPAP